MRPDENETTDVRNATSKGEREERDSPYLTERKISEKGEGGGNILAMFQER
jgi:hypothetical protein